MHTLPVQSTLIKPTINGYIYSYRTQTFSQLEVKPESPQHGLHLTALTRTCTNMVCQLAYCSVLKTKLLSMWRSTLSSAHVAKVHFPTQFGLLRKLVALGVLCESQHYGCFRLTTHQERTHQELRTVDCTLQQFREKWYLAATWANHAIRFDFQRLGHVYLKIASPRFSKQSTLQKNWANPAPNASHCETEERNYAT